MSSIGCQHVKHGPKTILLKLLTILLSGSPYRWWTRQQLTAGLIHQQSQLRKSTLHVRRPFRATNVLTVELVGTNQFQMFATVSIKQNLTLQQKRSRAAVDYSSCICKSGGEAARGSLPALSPQSDQVISCVMTKRRLTSGRAPDPGLKQQAIEESVPYTDVIEAQATSYKASSRKRQASSPKLQASSCKPQATSSLILDPS